MRAMHTNHTHTSHTRRISIFVFSVACVALASLALLLTPSHASAGVEDWHKGASIRSHAPEAFAADRFNEAIEDLAAANANFVTLVLPWKQQTRTSSEIYRVYATPREEALVAGIQAAHELGLAVNLKVHLDEENYGWRARIQPHDTDAWFRSYGEMLLDYARIAEEHDVEMITLGSELIGVTGPEHTHRWRNIIAQMRDVYAGELTYSANWGGAEWSREKDHIEFWDDLDYIGLAAYFNFHNPHTMDNLLQQWDHWEREHIGPLQRQWDMPVIFSEIGYRSMEGTLQSPWDWGETEAPVDESAQALGYQALFEYWDRHDYFRGVHLWVWRMGDENPSWATDYTPQGKRAEDVMAEWFAIGADEQEDPAAMSALEEPPIVEVQWVSLVTQSSAAAASLWGNLGTASWGTIGWGLARWLSR